MDRLVDKNIGSTIVETILSYLMMQQVEWTLAPRLLVGTFVLLPWFWIVARWLLMPVWNLLYIPTPNAPVDEGIIESNVYRNSNRNLYLRGHYFDIIGYTEMANNEILCLERMSSDAEASLEKTDTTVKLLINSSSSAMALCG